MQRSPMSSSLFSRLNQFLHPINLPRSVKNFTLIFSLLVTFHSSLLPALVAGTLIKTPRGLVPIEELNVGDKVSSTGPDRSLIEVRVTNIYPVDPEQIVAIETAKGVVYASIDQLFYDPILNDWIKAENLTCANSVMDCDGKSCACIAIEPLNEVIDLYEISVEPPHLFFISEAQILTHNFAPLAAIAAFFSFAAAEVPPAIAAAKTAVAGVGLATMTLSLIIDKIRGPRISPPASTPTPKASAPTSNHSHKHKHHRSNHKKKSSGNNGSKTSKPDSKKPTPPTGGGNVGPKGNKPSEPNKDKKPTTPNPIDGKSNLPSKDAQAPGKPTEQDGYIPPKKWNGEKVKNPNGPGVGYPDENGQVWMPTGPGSKAHGGPHWDVQNPKTGRHKNILPGGKER